MRKTDRHANKQMDRWMDGWMDGWLAGWIDKACKTGYWSKEMQHCLARQCGSQYD